MNIKRMADSSKAANITVKPTPSKVPLLNPGKGWVLYDLPNNQSKKTIAIGNLGYKRYNWSEIEPEEGHFNWEPIDTFISSWAQLGKQSAFGVMCTSTVSDGYVTPKWVFDAGVPVRIWSESYEESISFQGLEPEFPIKFLVWTGPNSQEIVYGKETWDVIKKPIDVRPNQKVEVADYHNPIFLEKLQNLLIAMAKRFDGNPHIAFIDIRSYLNYGEQFSKRHVKLHLEIFKKTRLCQSCPHYGDYPEFDWAAKQGIAIRRDGIGGSDGRECTRAFGFAPAIFEFWGDYENLQKQGWWRKGQMLKEAVEIGKPSYIGLSQWGDSAQIFLAAERTLIENLANRMGYHFVLKKIMYPEIMSKTKKYEIELHWSNTGVAPIYIPCAVAIGLLTQKGKLVDKCWTSECKPSDWYPNKDIVEKAEIAFPNVHPENYNLAIGLYQHIGDVNPAIRLGIQGKIVNGWHILGDIKVTM